MAIREMVTISEAARRLGVSRQAVHQRLAGGLEVHVEGYGTADGKQAAFLLVDFIELQAKWGTTEPEPEVQA
jgi:hypothetical protein